MQRKERRKVDDIIQRYTHDKREKKRKGVGTRHKSNVEGKRRKNEGRVSTLVSIPGRRMGRRANMRKNMARRLFHTIIMNRIRRSASLSFNQIQNKNEEARS